MAPLGETIAVIDKSGKVVSTSKQLFGVFNHAKAAYRERKAHFDLERSAKLAEQQALAGIATYQIDDSPSPPALFAIRTRLAFLCPRGYQDFQDVPLNAPTRRHTHHDLTTREPERPLTSRSKSDANIDMDLAYGDAHPKALAKYSPQPDNGDNQKQLDGLVDRAKWLLEEAHCVQHSATQTMSHLQKNPDAMAAVALTLAEISKVASNLAPSALAAFKTAAPTIFALLSSPQFLIAAGVGLSATVVMFGGYKIIKQMTGEKQEPVIERVPSDMGMDDLMELNVEELSHVEMWRRGVADVEAVSYGTSVDGEFITPTAAAMSGIDVTTARLEKDPRFKFSDDASMASSRRSRRSRSTRAHTQAPPASTWSKKEPKSTARRESSRPPTKAPTKAPSQAPSRAPSRSHAPSRPPSKTSSKAGSVIYEERRPKEKRKGPSRLRLLFTA
ncbi:hypothetical protein N7470_004476 [Penicillium chermesinum]|nr:hypothetical protein N7470_004476 [Penicillium chermesinum]